MQQARINPGLDGSKKPPQAVAPYNRSIEEASSPTKSVIQSVKQPDTKKDAALLYHQKVVEERNPYKFIEKTLVDARLRLDKMKDTPKLIEGLSDNAKKKKFLKAENKQLRD